MNENWYRGLEFRAAAGDQPNGFRQLVALENDLLDARFSPADILCPLELGGKLAGGQAGGPVAMYLHGRLREEERARLAEFFTCGQRPPAGAVAAILVEALNSALLVDDLKSVCGAGVGLAAGEGSGLATAAVRHCRENRMLLEAAFPGELRRRDWQQPGLVSSQGHAGEPWVAFTTDDRTGLALSGGGVRSATVQLGLLQALASKGLLGRFDYLATVSGGGYVGGFWTRWRRARHRPAPAIAPPLFPQPEGGAVGGAYGGRIPKEIREPREIRHLREFSRFLIPRRGLNGEFWAAAVAVVSGLVPSLTAAAAVVVGVIALAACLAVALLGQGLPSAVVGAVLAGAVGLVLWWADGWARNDGEIEDTPQAQRAYSKWYAVATALALAGVGLAQWLLPGGVGWVGYDWQGWSVAAGTLDSSVDLFRPSYALLVALGVLTLGQLWMARWGRCASPAGAWAPYPEASWGRVMGRLFAVLVGWTAFAVLWRAADWIVGLGDARAPSIRGLGGAMAVFTALFCLVRDWLERPKVENRATDLLGRCSALAGSGAGWVAWLKPLVPRLLANGIVVLLFLLAAVALQYFTAKPTLGVLTLWCGASGGLLALVLWWFDPAALGLHEFYRGRLARCFLGAGRAGLPTEVVRGGAGDNERVLVERQGDDMWLHDDIGLPIHLICCAANQTMANDHLATLHRGARSVVLSRFGIAMGGHWRADEPLRLSSALTASAAAFNSLMGERTQELGRAVAFVMTALNLRLGLWVRHPAAGLAPRRSRFRCPGAQFLREMLGMVQCRVDGRGGQRIHLSDGGHYENLGLYELIRRHCRYIVVADAGEDVRFAFDDLGRAVRRVREDFGVEIEIDLEPLKPGADGLASQHLVVGVVHYDGVVGTDKGTLVYFKPSMTGDEPPDVLQYRQRKPDFPHESTGDQFFDEAQFESYRRLGEHMVNAAVGRLERLLFDPAVLPDESLFWRLRLAWDRKPPWLEHEAGVRLWDHARELDALLGNQDTAAHCLPYLGITGEGLGAGACREALLAIEVCKLLEEAWVVCELDRNCTHPAASSWMSRLHRWAGLPVVREWWLVIKPLFGEGFQEFAEQRLHLQGVVGASVPEGARASRGPEGIGAVVPRAMDRLKVLRPGCVFPVGTRQAFQLVLDLPRREAGGRLLLQVGLAQVAEEEAGGGNFASWALEDLFIPPEFAFGDYTSCLLDALIRHYRKERFARLEVRLEEVRNRDLVERRLGRETVSRRQQTDLIDFYRSRGFRYDVRQWRQGRCVGMFLQLTGASTGEGMRPEDQDADGAAAVRLLRLKP